MHKLYLVIVIVLVPVFGFGQNTGTLKVSKNSTPEIYPKRPKRHIYGSILTTFAGESTPKTVRDQEFKLGTYWDLLANERFVFIVGLNTGTSQLSETLKGIGTGPMLRYELEWPIGPTLVYIPLEVSYKRMFNRIEGFNDWNQTSIGAGFSVLIPNPNLPGLCLSFSGQYKIDSYQGTNRSGLFPSVGMEFRF